MPVKPTLKSHLFLALATVFTFLLLMSPMLMSRHSDMDFIKFALCAIIDIWFIFEWLFHRQHNISFDHEE